jgi:prolyl-tRNA editing enzyme YbaK/EbsC (Cys-tRNA(Pro) deacylase)
MCSRHFYAGDLDRKSGSGTIRLLFKGSAASPPAVCCAEEPGSRRAGSGERSRMRVEEVKALLAGHGLADAYLEFSVSSATVELAARAIGCEPGRIAKTLAFITKDGPLLVVVMGTARVDNKKFKRAFGEKARFPSLEQVEALTGHPVGGVCPFAALPGVRVALDQSLRCFDPLYPAAGAPNNAVRVSLADLERLTQAPWVDVCTREDAGADGAIPGFPDGTAK